ncbi:CPBP family intramembrane metalloprotease [Nonomuraea sp. NBC_01738]|uniref:CPBP family intramembrane glutamic endopeptidase n=1 Tax=Nonomuraea sp. NBC_01738 TaxID=2976003 RepID=UPI002E132FFB|nr:CPBP family intramembrane metalloprotease [Nonomuraea sp. NBC_01738]
MQENQIPYGQPYPPPAVNPPWFLPAPRGARYDHLARNGAGELWRPIVGTLVVAAGFLVIGLVVIFAGLTLSAILGFTSPVSGQLFGNPLLGLVFSLLSIAAVLPLVFGTVALVQRRLPGTLSSVAGRLRWTWLLMCVGLAVVALVLGQLAQAAALAMTGEQTEGMIEWAGWSEFGPALVVIVLLVPFQAATEEYIFRGWLIQAFGTRLANPVWAIVIGSLLFASLHGYSWVGLVDVFAFGAVMGFVAVRTGGLEAPIAMHVVNNMLAFGLSAAAGKLDQALDQGGSPVPWQALAGTVVQLAVFSAGVFFLAKKRSVSTISG